MVSVKPDLERVRYWQGQLLSAADLREQVATDLELRRWHDRVAHRAVGIAIGLGVELDDTKTAVVVQRGLAYDGLSRPLLLPESRSLPLPSASEPLPQLLVLVLDANATAGVALRWRRGRDWDVREGIALRRLRQVDGTAERELDPDFRPVVARPLARPHTVAGQTIPGETAWQPWSLGGVEVGVQVRVDTSAAGFSAQPHYFADAIAGHLADEIQPAWFASIGEPSETEFTFRLMFRGITVQPLDFVDPRPRVTRAARLDDIALDEGAFAFADRVVRLVPVTPRARQVESIDEDDGVVHLVPVPKWLEAEKPGPEEPLKRIGACLLPRRGLVESTSSGTGQALVVSEPAVDKDRYLMRIEGLDSPPPPSSSLVKVVDTFAGGLSVLSAEVPDAKQNEKFAKIDSTKTVSAHAEGKTHITVTDARPFQDHPVAILIKSDAVDIVKIESIKENTLILAQALGRAEVGDALSAVTDDEVELSRPRPQSEWQRITFLPSTPVEAIKRFRSDDLVAKGSATDEADAQLRRIEAVSQTAILLEAPIPNLAKNEELVAATVGARATVRGVDGSFVTVDAPARFRDGFIARVDADFELEAPVWVASTATTDLTLQDAPSPPLKVGDVIARCDFPRSVIIQQVREEREILVDNDGVLRTGDVVMRLPRKGDAEVLEGEVANVTWVEATEPKLVLARSLTHLQQGDELLVVNLGQVATAKTDDDDLKMIDRRQLRAGDALGTIVTWRQSEIGAAWASVTNTQTFTLDLWPDGLLPGDILGLPSARFPVVFVRLESMPGLQVFDSVSLTGTDVARGEVVAAQAIIFFVDADKRLFLVVIDAPEAGGREYRPDDLTATAPFLRGSALDVIRNQDLFVSWLAVEDPLRMPRELEAPKPADCPCAPASDLAPRSGPSRKDQ